MPICLCCLVFYSKEDGDRDLKIRQAITDSAIPHQKGMNQSYDPFPLTEREDGAMVNPLKETSWGHKENVEMKDVLVKEHTHLVEKEAVVVKEETSSSAGASLLAESSDLTSSHSEWSHSDSGLHSNGSNGTTAFSSASSIFSSSKNSASFKPSSDVVEHCLPDSTTDNDIIETSGKGSSNQMVSESIVCWDSPSNGVGGSEHSLTPPSVFHEEPASSAPLLTTSHSISYSPHQNGSASSGSVGQATAAATSYMPQGLQHSVTTEPFTPEPRQFMPMGTPGFGSFGGGSGTSQPQSGGQLYQLLSKQPPQSQLGGVATGNTIYGNSAGYANGGNYQSFSSKGIHFTDPANGISNKLPAWNGIETEFHVHSIPQQPLSVSTGFVNGANSVQPSWQPDVDPLPQLTDEDMRILDCFNETTPLT